MENPNAIEIKRAEAEIGWCKTRIVKSEKIIAAEMKKIDKERADMRKAAAKLAELQTFQLL